ncbi:hypothetical protein [Pedobacter sp. Leaf132]|uniref:hypothetical protein n=1 Tax=Pedobacter sp. Leaf132 TaxID=2876557 RepID=UPI001E648B54|nr:hypothetical protein [Pedobacter sp. Leaf132]
MKKIKFYIVALAICLTSVVNAQKTYNNLLKDFESLSGDWNGSLTYLDYSTGKPYTMPANIVVKRIGKTNKFSFANIYPNEMNANSVDTIMISTDGKLLNDELVISHKRMLTGNTEIITETMGTDGNENKPATIKHIYTVGNKVYKKQKYVKFNPEDEWIKRHEYAYTR